MPVFTGDLPKASYTKVLHDVDGDFVLVYVDVGAQTCFFLMIMIPFFPADRHVASVLHHQHHDQHLHPHHRRLASQGGAREEKAK